jgi:hypothetical protein
MTGFLKMGILSKCDYLTSLVLDSGKTSDYVNMTQRPPRVNGWWKKGAGTWSGLV